MDYYSDYEKFLKETADEVGSFVSDRRNLRRFRQQARLFVKQHEVHCEARDQYEKKAATDPRLRDYSKGPPGPGWRWTSILTLNLNHSKNPVEGYWAPSDDLLPPNPFEWFSGPPVVIGAPHEAEQPCCEKNKLPCRETLLPCCYVLLITVHDNWCPPGFPLISEGIWSQEKGDLGYSGSCGDKLRNAVFKDLLGEYKFRFRRKIEWALNQVKADLPVKVDLAKREPAETEQRETPTKEEHSLPLHTKQWAYIFGVSPNKIRELRRGNKYHFRQVSPRRWTLPRNELPVEYLVRYGQVAPRHDQPNEQ